MFDEAIKQTAGKQKCYIPEEVVSELLNNSTKNPYFRKLQEFDGDIFDVLYGIYRVLKNTQDEGKYPEDSWKCVDPSLYVDAMMRHAFPKDCELFDSESGLKHQWHFWCNMMFLGWFWMKREEKLDTGCWGC